MKRRTFPRAACATLAVSLLLALTVFISPAASSQGRRAARQDVERALESFDELSLDPASVLREVRKTGSLRLNTSRGTFDLALEPFDIRTDDYRSVSVEGDGTVRELPRAPSHAFKGTVRGAAGTQVRLIIDEQQFEGIIATPDENFFVEPESHLSASAAAGDFVFYPQSGVKRTNVGVCGTTLAERVGGQASAATASQPKTTAAASKGLTGADAFAPMPDARVATESDFEYTQTFGGNSTNANNDILNILTQVDAIYNRDLGINLHVCFQRAWATEPANYPYTSTTDAGTALNQFADKYDASFGSGSPTGSVPPGNPPVPSGTPPSRDLAHMFTGRLLANGTIGISFPGVVCDVHSAFGISESKFDGTGNVAERVALTAHEIGHNFGATHTGPSSNPADPPQQIPGCGSDSDHLTIMQPFIDPNAKGFCQFSIDEITNFTANSAGCLARLVNGCTYSIDKSSASFTNNGGTASVNVTAVNSAPSGPACGWAAAEGASWIAVTSGQTGTGNGVVALAVVPNNGNNGPRTSAVDIGGKTFTVNEAASNLCAQTPIAIGQTLTGSLDTTDCVAGQPQRPNAFGDLYTFAGRAGQRIKIELSAANSAGLDTFIYLFAPDNSVLATEDDIDTQGGNTDSRLPLAGFLTLPQTGIYTIEATSFDNKQTGGYTLKLSDDSSTNTVALSSSAYAVAEGVGSDGLGTDGTGLRVITVTRTGDASGTATVDYVTTNGTADKHGDYEQTLGTLVFAPGQTTQTFTILIPDDRLAEQPETVNIMLSNPVGTTLGSPASATLTIGDNDAANAPSPVRWDSNFNTGFFVRQQYLDFLSREPDSSGFNFWSGDINNCGTNDGCAQAHRVNVSAAFFLSIEFQETGYLVERIYKTAFGDADGKTTLGDAPGSSHTIKVPAVRLEQFLPDTQRIGQGVVVGVGNWQQQLDSNKNAFAEEFVMRPAFVSAYPLTLTPAAFVDKLNQNAGGVLTQTERDNLVAQLSAVSDMAAGRAAVLRSIAENPVLDANEKNRAFVLMQFFGYLRRNPDGAPDADYTGYDFWLQKLNQFNGNFVQAEMVKAFITSIEYNNRFGT